jgi:hypothetical protein
VNTYAVGFLGKESFRKAWSNKLGSMRVVWSFVSVCFFLHLAIVNSFGGEDVAVDQSTLARLAERNGLAEMAVNLTIVSSDGQAIPTCSGSVQLMKVRHGGRLKSSFAALCDSDGRLSLDLENVYGLTIEIRADDHHGETWQWYPQLHADGVLLEEIEAGRGVVGQARETIVLDRRFNQSPALERVSFRAGFGEENLRDSRYSYFCNKHQRFRFRVDSKPAAEQSNDHYPGDFKLMIVCGDSTVGVAPMPRSRSGLPERRKGCKLVLVGGREGDGFLPAGPFEDGLALRRRWRRAYRAPGEGYLNELVLNGTFSEPADVFYFRLNGIYGKGRVCSHFLMPYEGQPVRTHCEVTAVYDSSGGFELASAVF